MPTLYVGGTDAYVGEAEIGTSIPGYVDGQDITEPTSLTTAYVATPVANRAIILHVAQYRETGTPTQPTVSGCNLTWTAEHTFLFDEGAGTDTCRITLFSGIGASPTQGPLTIEYASQAGNSLEWHGEQIDGTFDVLQIVEDEQSTTLADTTALATLAAFADPANLHLAIGFYGSATPPTGLSESFILHNDDRAYWYLTGAAETQASWSSGSFGVVWSLELDTVGGAGAAAVPTMALMGVGT